MPSAVSGQDEPNLALSLATRAGKMELSCLLGIRTLSRKYTDHALVLFSHIINPLLTKREVKMAGYWPSSFFECKKRTWPISSHLDLTLGQ